MNVKARERLRALAHEALIQLEKIDSAASARGGDPVRAMQLEFAIEHIRAFLFKLIGTS